MLRHFYYEYPLQELYDRRIYSKTTEIANQIILVNLRFLFEFLFNPYHMYTKYQAYTEYDFNYRFIYHKCKMQMQRPLLPQKVKRS